MNVWYQELSARKLISIFLAARTPTSRIYSLVTLFNPLEMSPIRPPLSELSFPVGRVGIKMASRSVVFFPPIFFFIN